MQCIWQNLARISSTGLSSVARPSIIRIFHHNTSFRVPFNPQKIRNLSIATSPHPSRSPLSFLQAASFPESTETPTPAQGPPSRLALSATRAIHASLRERALEDAFFIVNSVRYAALPKPQQDKSWDAVKRSSLYFPPGISPRLPTHALLHGLVRLGLPQQASQLATNMMDSGIRVRGKTLERIIGGLTKPPITKNASREAEFKRHMGNLLGSSKILSLKSSMASDPNAAFALELLRAAKKSRSQRTGAMFNMLITLCLVNGEIILASLIFGLLVKEWEFRSQILTRVVPSQVSEGPMPASPSTKLDTAYRYDLLTKTLQPTPGILKAIVAPIHDRLAQATPSDSDTPELQEALQALANLASLVDKRQLPFPQLSSVLWTLPLCPRVENGVWVAGPEGPSFVPAYRYFHDVLLRLMGSLPTKNPAKQTIVLQRATKLVSIQFKLHHPVHCIQPPLDTPSYNALMHYALTNRFSPKLAKQVYEHMTIERDPPLPGKSRNTFNIILRSATLYRRTDMDTQLFKILQPYIPSATWETLIQPKLKPPRLPPKFHHLTRPESNLALPSEPNLKTIIKDNYSLSTYLSSLISNGQPRLVVHLMQQLLPIVRDEHRPDSSAEADVNRQQIWLESLNRAVVFGPHVLGTFLHALIRSGTTKKSHILFKLIVHAAKKSHDPKFLDEPRPWHISLPIYTMMLQAHRVEYERFRRKTGRRLLNYLLCKTAIIYDMVQHDLRQNIPGMKPDSRFFDALLKIFAKFLPTRKASISEATEHLVQARQQFAKAGSTDDRGYSWLFEKVAEDMEALGYTIPVGFHHLFFGKRVHIHTGANEIPEAARLPFAFSKSRVVGGPYSLPVSRRKSLPSNCRPRFRRPQLS